jgi:hypothetical protein
MASLTGDWGRASPRYEFCAPSLDDFRQTIELLPWNNLVARCCTL